MRWLEEKTIVYRRVRFQEKLKACMPTSRGGIPDCLPAGISCQEVQA